MDILLSLLFLVGAILLAIVVLGIAILLTLKIPILVGIIAYTLVKIIKKFKN